MNYIIIQEKLAEIIISQMLHALVCKWSGINIWVGLLGSRMMHIYVE